MKLETSITPRKDGTVRVRGIDKNEYTFALDAETGMVACDIEHPETLAHLLSLGGFFPADEADHEKAASLIDMVNSTGEIDGDGPDELDGDDDEEANPDALPVEAGTPPAPRKKKAKAE